MDDLSPKEDKKRQLIIGRYTTGDVLLPRYLVFCIWTQYYTGRACVNFIYSYQSEEHLRFPFTRVCPHAIHLRRHVKCNGLTISLAANFPKLTAANI